MSLDERIRTARSAVRAMPVAPAPPIDVLARRAGRRRAFAGITAIAVLVVAAVVVWESLPGSSRTITQLEVPDTLAPPPDTRIPPDTQSPSPDTSIVAAGAALVSPVPFGSADLVFVPGALGIDAQVSVVDGIVEVDAAGVSARVIDLGPAPASADDPIDDPKVPIADVPRLGPSGPRVVIGESAGESTAEATVGQRRVQAASADLNTEWLAELLRSVTTAGAATPIRPGTVAVTLADVVGVDYRDATAQLEVGDVRVAWTLQATSDHPPGVVLSMAPAAGDVVATGSRVVLTVSGPESSRRVRDPFVMAAGPDLEISTIGYLAMVLPPAGFPGGPGQGSQSVRQPIVFLHGELVGVWSQEDLSFDGSALLTDLTDPTYRPRPGTSSTTLPASATPPTSPTLSAPPLTQTAELQGVSVDLPADWTIQRDGCPVTHSVSVGAMPADCAVAAVPGPWLSLRPSPDVLTPCRPSSIGTAMSGGQLRVCGIDGLTNSYMLLGTRVQVTKALVPGDLSDPVASRVIETTLRAPAALGEVPATPAPVSVDLVAALLVGRCDLAVSLVDPESTEVALCQPGTPGATPAPPGQFVSAVEEPTIDPRDLTRDAASVWGPVGDGGVQTATNTWHVETRTYYDPATDDAVTLVTRLVDPSGRVLIAPR